MPYYHRSWNVALGEAEIKSGRHVRKCPLGENGQNACSSKKSAKSPDPQTIELARSTLKFEVEGLKATPGAISIKDAQQAFEQYVLQKKEKPVYEGKHSAVVNCSNPSKPSEMRLICHIYEPPARVFVSAGFEYLFLKVLRKLGNTNPHIISTFDIFCDDDRQVYIFQEFASKGNAHDYIKSASNDSLVDESTALGWAQSIYSALDHCGALGIAHRAIEPSHVLLVVATAGGDSVVVAKLGGFHNAVIYYDPERCDLVDLPCKSPGKRPFYPYQAPEVFGESGEYFNVVDADVWSFAATFLFIAGRLEPQEMIKDKAPSSSSSSSSSLDDIIFKNIDAVARLSEAAKYFFFGCLRANTAQRTSFDAIALDSWMQGDQQSPSV